MTSSSSARALVISLVLLSAVIGPRSYAQQPPEHMHSLEKLTEEANDPTAILAKLKIENDYTPDQYGTQAEPNTIIIQPVVPILPFSLMPLTQLVRPTFRVVTIPYGSGPATNTQFGDMQLIDLLVAPWPDFVRTRLRWGIGPYFLFPTATTSAAGSGTWRAGPAGAIVYRGIRGLLLGGLLRQSTSFAYTEPDRKPVTRLTFQPFLVYQLGRGWYLRSRDATWKFNLRHNTSTEIPLSAGIGKVWKFGEDHALNASLVGEWMVYRQFAPNVEQFTLKFQITLLLPRLQL